MTSSNSVKPWRIAAIAVGLAMLTALALNWERVMWAAAALFAEQRPALLRDADWGDPTSAIAFNDEFAPGTSEAKLLAWLARNDFQITSEGTASRRVEGLPCNEHIVVQWRANDGRLSSVQAKVREAGCL